MTGAEARLMQEEITEAGTAPSTGVPESEKPAVSVIVPVYNVEPWLRRCVDSIIHQTLRNIEIILVDDGSTDGSGAICDEYAAMDARIRVVHQENAGLSEARNAGIDRARADYLMFVDSDDWVEPDFCRIPYDIAREQQADLVMFQFRRIRNGKEKKRKYSITEGRKSQEEAIDLTITGATVSAWNKLYHRDLFRENRYPKGMVYEDLFLTPVLVHEARRVFYTSAVLYNQEYRESSITTDLSGSSAQDWLDARTLTAQHLKEWGYASKAESYYLMGMLSFAAKGWRSPELKAKCIRYLRSIKRCPAHFPLKQRCKFHLCRISPGLYRLVCRGYRLLNP